MTKLKSVIQVTQDLLSEMVRHVVPGELVTMLTPGSW